MLKFRWIQMITFRVCSVSNSLTVADQKHDVHRLDIKGFRMTVNWIEPEHVYLCWKRLIFMALWLIMDKQDNHSAKWLQCRNERERRKFHLKWMKWKWINQAWYRLFGWWLNLWNESLKQWRTGRMSTHNHFSLKQSDAEYSPVKHCLFGWSFILKGINFLVVLVGSEWLLSFQTKF